MLYEFRNKFKHCFCPKARFHEDMPFLFFLWRPITDLIELGPQEGPLICHSTLHWWRQLLLRVLHLVSEELQ